MKMRLKTLRISLLAGTAFVLATGLWAPAGAAVYDYGITSPDDGAVTSTRFVDVKVAARSDSSQGLQYLRLELEGPGFSPRVVWCSRGKAPTCESFSSKTESFDETDGSFNWDTAGLTTYNGDYLVKLVVKDGDGVAPPRNITVKVNTPPAIPSWTSVTPARENGQQRMILKWRANAEPDIVSYKITRSSSNGGPSTFFKVENANPGGQGCSLSSGIFTCTDSSFASSGYAGTYTYYLAATRSSPVTSSGVSSGQSARAASVSEPKPSPTTGGGGGNGGTGGNNNGGGSRPAGPGGPTGFPTQPGATLTPTPDPDAVDPAEFYTGTFDKQLPYKERSTLVLGQQERKVIAGFAGEDDLVPLDARKTLLPVAGGLFTLTAALHFRRVIRDH